MPGFAGVLGSALEPGSPSCCPACTLAWGLGVTQTGIRKGWSGKCPLRRCPWSQGRALQPPRVHSTGSNTGSRRTRSGVAARSQVALAFMVSDARDTCVWGGKQEFRFGQRCAEVACGPAVLETDPGELPARGGPQAREGTQDGRRPGGPRPDWGSGGRSRCQPSACARRRCTHAHSGSEC